MELTNLRRHNNFFTNTWMGLTPLRRRKGLASGPRRNATYLRCQRNASVSTEMKLTDLGHGRGVPADT